MMRYMLTIAALAFGASANAQEVDRAAQVLELSATAGSACVISTPRARAVTNANFQATGDGNATVGLTRLVDPNTALPRGASFELEIPATCNASHRVTAASGKGGLGRVGAAGTQAQGFADLLPYTLRLDWAGASQERSSNAGMLVLAVANGATGNLALLVNTPDGGTPLIAGDYDDTIVIQLQPTD